MVTIQRALTYVAVASDLFGDGLMLGAGASLSVGLGLTLAVGQVLADVPEGFASVFTFKANGVPRRRRIALSASFLLPTLLGAGLAYGLLRGRGEAVQLAALVGTAGLFTVAAFEDMIREAHETRDDSHLSTLALIGGFALFVLVSAGLG
jgi:ZIP family zinc transporter